MSWENILERITIRNRTDTARPLTAELRPDGHVRMSLGLDALTAVDIDLDASETRELWALFTRAVKANESRQRRQEAGTR